MTDMPNPNLGPGQVAIYHKAMIGHVAKDWASPKVREALDCKDNWVVGPIKRMSALLDSLGGPCEHKVTIVRGWMRIDPNTRNR